MKTRRTARAFVVDKQGRMLLFRFEVPTLYDPDSGPRNEVFWATVGGAIAEGETFRRALARELFEETGLGEKDAAISEPLWYGEHDLVFAGELTHFVEQFALVQVQSSEVSLSGLTEDERQVYRGHRWWSVNELRGSQETIYPPKLDELLASILAGELPSGPREIRL